ncbi:hypothetical protein HQ560_07230 [bacterium]|nr:hypothetical protein [bacterium]
MTMTLTQHNSATAFLDAARATLEAAEAANNLMLGIATWLAKATDPPERPPYMATVRDRALRVAALMTPPHRLILGGGHDGPALDAVIHDLLDGGRPVPGVVGPENLSKAFAAHWGHHTGSRCSEAMHLRIYRLTEAALAPPAEGTLRRADPGDTDTVGHWIHRFNHDIRETIPPDDPRAMAESRIAAGDIYLWDHHGPVAMAATARKTRHGVTLNLVYTPPELRGKAYATSCVTQLCRQLLADEWRFCCLFADLANPVSNHIYRKIGFRPVCDFVEFDFHPPK